MLKGVFIMSTCRKTRRVEGTLLCDRTGRRTNIVEVMDAVTRRCHEDVAVHHLPRAHTQESASGD